MEQRECRVCDRPFTPNSPNQQCCPPSDEERARARARGARQARSRCAKRWSNHLHRGTSVLHGKVAPPFDCAECGKCCTPGQNVAHHATKFCGRTCKARWHARQDGRRAALAAAQARLLRIADQAVTRRDEAEYRRATLADPCAYCGAPSTQLDHIDPKSQGGSDAWHNRAGTCASCNGRKQDVPMLLWMGWRMTRVAHNPWDDARRALLTRT